jgi:hypothetical protein
MLTAEQAARFDPFCPPDWRWLRALRLAKKASHRLKGVNDPAIPPAVAFLVARKKSRRKAAPVNEDLEKTLALYQDDSPLQWEIRARLVAGQSDEEIASRCRLQPSVIGWYASLFYDVRPRLKAMDWLVHFVTGFGRSAGFRNDEVGPFWAFNALARGPVAVDYLVDMFHQARRPGQPPTLAVYLGDGVPLDLQGVIALFLLPLEAQAWVDEFNRRRMEAEAVGDPVLLKVTKEVNCRDAIGLAKLVLEGKPLPESPMQRQSRKSPRTARGQSDKQTSGGGTGPPVSDVAPDIVDSPPLVNPKRR